MAQIPGGILGALIGKIGPVIGYQRNSQNIIRTSTSRKDGKITPARTEQREKITVCNIFTKTFSGTGFFNRTFPAYGGRGTGYNRATSAIMDSAVVGMYPNVSFSYPSILISKGTLPKPQDATVDKDEQNNLSFTWKNNSKVAKAKTSDKVVIVAYFPALQQAIFSIGTATRKDGKAILQINHFKVQTAETWISFISSNEEEAAGSIYTGSIT